MSPQAALYVGSTWHQRFEPKPHRFRYDLFQLLIDVDRTAAGLEGLRLIRHGRHGLFSFAERDHGYRDGAPLRGWVQDRLAEAGLPAAPATIRLLSMPRVLGFVFNPISVFFAYDADERLTAIVYEVNNTFGQTHAYVVAATGEARERHSAAKRLYVSPFYRVEGDYSFSVTPPEAAFHLTIVKSRPGGRRDFTASLDMTRSPLTDAALLRLFFAMPLVTLKVVAAIHWEALRLWLKGAPSAPARRDRRPEPVGAFPASPDKRLIRTLSSSVLAQIAY